MFRGEVASAAQQALLVFVTNDAASPVPVKQQGAIDVNVLGSVSTRPNIPITQFSVALNLNAATIISGPDPAGTNYAITSISVANAGSTFAIANVASYYGTTTDCQNFVGAFDLTNGQAPTFRRVTRSAWSFRSRSSLPPKQVPNVSDGAQPGPHWR